MTVVLDHAGFTQTPNKYDLRVEVTFKIVLQAMCEVVELYCNSKDWQIHQYFTCNCALMS